MGLACAIFYQTAHYIAIVSWWWLCDILVEMVDRSLWTVPIQFKIIKIFPFGFLFCFPFCCFVCCFLLLCFCFCFFCFSFFLLFYLSYFSFSFCFLFFCFLFYFVFFFVLLFLLFLKLAYFKLNIVALWYFSFGRLHSVKFYLQYVSF